MNDIYLEWGGDLMVDSSGDIAIATSVAAINQRLCRRLLTNPGDYIWNLDYGGGLAQFVGSTANLADIEAVVNDQVGLETAIPATPSPKVSVDIADQANGYVVATITYADSATNQSVVATVTPG